MADSVLVPQIRNLRTLGDLRRKIGQQRTAINTGRRVDSEANTAFRLAAEQKKFDAVPIAPNLEALQNSARDKVAQYNTMLEHLKSIMPVAYTKEAAQLAGFDSNPALVDEFNRHWPGFAKYVANFGNINPTYFVQYWQAFRRSRTEVERDFFFRTGPAGPGPGGPGSGPGGPGSGGPGPSPSISTWSGSTTFFDAVDVPGYEFPHDDDISTITSEGVSDSDWLSTPRSSIWSADAEDTRSINQSSHSTPAQDEQNDPQEEFADFMDRLPVAPRRSAAEQALFDRYDQDWQEYMRDLNARIQELRNTAAVIPNDQLEEQVQQARQMTLEQFLQQHRNDLDTAAQWILQHGGREMRQLLQSDLGTLHGALRDDLRVIADHIQNQRQRDLDRLQGGLREDMAALAQHQRTGARADLTDAVEYLSNRLDALGDRIAAVIGDRQAAVSVLERVIDANTQNDGVVDMEQIEDDLSAMEEASDEELHQAIVGPRYDAQAVALTAPLADLRRDYRAHLHLPLLREAINTYWGHVPLTEIQRRSRDSNNRLRVLGLIAELRRWAPAPAGQPAPNNEGNTDRPRRTIIRRGGGIAAPAIERYEQFGKYLIHMPSLESNILNIKFPSHAVVPKLPRQVISDELANVIRDLLKQGQLNASLYAGLGEHDKDILSHVTHLCNIGGKLGIAKKQDNKDLQRFQIVRGEILAGNDAIQLIKELKYLTLKLMSEGKLPKKTATDLLVEIAAL